MTVLWQFSDQNQRKLSLIKQKFVNTDLFSINMRFDFEKIAILFRCLSSFTNYVSDLHFLFYILINTTYTYPLSFGRHLEVHCWSSFIGKSLTIQSVIHFLNQIRNICSVQFFFFCFYRVVLVSHRDFIRTVCDKFKLNT